MRVNLHESIAGQPVPKVREFLKHSSGWYWDLPHVAQRLRIDRVGAQEFVAEMQRRGYIKKATSAIARFQWTNTMQGNAFAQASGAKPLLRASAEKTLKEFLARVKEIETSPRFLYRVRKVVLFGSYLTSNDRINDIDLYVALAPKNNNPDKQQIMEERHVKEAERRGRSFGTFVDRISWPQVEVLAYLKSRSRSISLHTDARILNYGKSKIIYTGRPINS